MTCCSKEQGNFTIEFALVAVFFSFVLMFSIDLVAKISMKGKLDRMSFSSVNIIRERTQLFPDEGFEVSEADFKSIDTIIKGSLKRTLQGFNEARYGSLLEIQGFDQAGAAKAISIYKGGRYPCTQGKPFNQKLSFYTSFHRKATLYRITLCYETSNFYGDLIGEDYKVVSSQSLTIGR